MSETTTPSSEPTTGPVGTTVTPSEPVVRDDSRRSRLNTVAAWVGIVAGVVFIVAVVFFSGFFLGARSAGGHHNWGYHRGGDGDRGYGMYHRGPDMPMMPMMPMGPRGPFGPGGPGGPGFQTPESPTTTAPARP